MKNTKGRWLLTSAAMVSGIMFYAARAQAQIVRIQINRVESPTFEGTSFGEVGQYEKLVGKAFGEVDPTEVRNAGITDIGLAPKNANGRVEYSMDIYILKPIDPSKGNGRVLYEINNRGFKLCLGAFNDSTTSFFSVPENDPTTAADAGNGFLMRQGYTIVWSGWDATVAAGNNLLTITAPVVKSPDGSSIVGPALEEFVIDNSTTLTGSLTYPAAALDKSQANLTFRHHYADPPIAIPSSGWEYVNTKTIRLLPSGTPFQLGSLYELTYLAKDPVVAGIGFAATRDFAVFLRSAAADEVGTPNPLAGVVQFVYSFGISQPARFMHDFLHLGFNDDGHGNRIFDAMYNYIGGASSGFFNYRFAQPSRTHRQHIARWYPELEFPFTNEVIFDPITRRKDGRLRNCLETDTCPKTFEANSENEYWSKAASLLHTDTTGNDLSLQETPHVRMYLLSSLAHVPVANSAPGICQQPTNSVFPNAAHRALLVALDQWVSADTKPPKSRIPRVSDGTLVPSLPQNTEGFPEISGVIYNGLLHTGDLYDFGPSFDEGILTTLPPLITESAYPSLVPRTDPDGNDIAGIRLPEIAVPLATYTGWALRAGPAANDGCDASGQQIAFAETKADRVASGDPRLSLEERYQTHEGYVREVEKAVRKLVRERLLLPEDAQRYIQDAEASGVLR